MDAIGRTVPAVLTALIAAATPAVLVGAALGVLLHPWLVEFVYALPGFPDDGQGLDERERTDLAIAGLRAARPFDDGTALLRDARLPDGGAAFAPREIAHMRDVRALIAGFAVVWAIALPLLLLAAVALARLRGRAATLRALGWGGWITIALVALACVAALIDFETFFDAFHVVFFAGETWEFDDADTLLRLYPEPFWIVASVMMAALVLVPAVWAARHARRLPPKRNTGPARVA